MYLFRALLVLSVIILFTGCKSAPDNLPWETNLEKAMQIAEKENKAVLVNFTGSDWCTWCKKLNSEVFSKKEFAEYAAKHLVLVKIDFPKSIEQTQEVKFYNHQLAQQFNIEGYPTIVLLGKQGNTLGVTGYQPGGPTAYIEHLKTMIP